MKISKGKWRNFNIKTYDNPNSNIRPAGARLRDSLFEMLASRNIFMARANNAPLRILDICCGSGIMTFEALSRHNSDSECLLLDKSVKSIDIAKSNWNSIQKAFFKQNTAYSHKPQLHFIKADATDLTKLHKHQNYDLIFIDPPFEQNLINQITQQIIATSWLNHQSYICIKIGKKQDCEFPENQNYHFTMEKEKIFGYSKLQLWKSEYKSS